MLAWITSFNPVQIHLYAFRHYFFFNAQQDRIALKSWTLAHWFLRCRNTMIEHLHAFAAETFYTTTSLVLCD